MKGDQSKVRGDRSPCELKHYKKLSEAASYAATAPRLRGGRGLRAIPFVVVLEQESSFLRLTLSIIRNQPLGLYAPCYTCTPTSSCSKGRSFELLRPSRDSWPGPRRGTYSCMAAASGAAERGSGRS